jgi:hypothetical protein
MINKILAKNLLPGFLSWLIPFLVSFLFYKPGGQLLVPYATFKSTIMLVGVISGCYLLFRYFLFVDGNYILNGVVVGFSWFAINIILDSIILIPMMKTSFTEYFISIGMSYFSIPTISILIGVLLSKKVNQ